MGLYFHFRMGAELHIFNNYLLAKSGPFSEAYYVNHIVSNIHTKHELEIMSSFELALLQLYEITLFDLC